MARTSALRLAYLRQIKNYPSAGFDRNSWQMQCCCPDYAKTPDIPVTLYLPNDPRTMKGAKTIAERKNLVTGLAQIICVSNYIQGLFS